MTPAEQYRATAAQLRSKAASAHTRRLAMQWEHLAKCYLRLAEQADHNSFQDLWLEIGPKTRLTEGEAR